MIYWQGPGYYRGHTVKNFMDYDTTEWFWVPGQDPQAGGFIRYFEHE